MRIGIDVSQVVYDGTGVARYVREMVLAMTQLAPQHEYVLFGATFRRKKDLEAFIEEVKQSGAIVRSVIVPLSPTVLDFLWNTLHIIPITWFTGPLDVFWSSDWTQPPLGGGIGMTTIHDVSFLRYPESFPEIIVSVQKQRLKHAIRENALFLCDSQTTKKDVMNYLHVPEKKLHVVYPGFTL
jgi:hypothetical protein